MDNTASPSRGRTRRLTTTAMLCAMAYAVMLVTRPLPSVMGFLSLDPKDVIVVIGGFIYGPLTSLIISAIVSFVEMITVSSTGPYGMIMNIFSTCSFAIPAALVYKKSRNMKGAVMGLAAGVVSVAVAMVLWNWIITPIYMKMPRNVVAAMLPTVFLPFNLVKGGINASITMLIYKPIVTALRAAKLVDIPAAGGKGKINVAITIATVIILAACVVLFVVLYKAHS